MTPDPTLPLTRASAIYVTAVIDAILAEAERPVSHEQLELIRDAVFTTLHSVNHYFDEPAAKAFMNYAQTMAEGDPAPSFLMDFIDLRRSFGT